MWNLYVFANVWISENSAYVYEEYLMVINLILNVRIEVEFRTIVQRFPYEIFFYSCSAYEVAGTLLVTYIYLLRIR